MLKSLGQILRATGLPQAVIDAIGIWTHVTGQRMERAPVPWDLYRPSSIRSDVTSRATVYEPSPDT